MYQTNKKMKMRVHLTEITKTGLVSKRLEVIRQLVAQQQTIMTELTSKINQMSIICSLT